MLTLPKGLEASMQVTDLRTSLDRQRSGHLGSSLISLDLLVLLTSILANDGNVALVILADSAFSNPLPQDLGSHLLILVRSVLGIQLPLQLLNLLSLAVELH